jgi:hypothetical protein
VKWLTPMFGHREVGYALLRVLSTHVTLVMTCAVPVQSCAMVAESGDRSRSGEDNDTDLVTGDFNHPSGTSSQQHYRSSHHSTVERTVTRKVFQA